MDTMEATGCDNARYLAVRLGTTATSVLAVGRSAEDASRWAAGISMPDHEQALRLHAGVKAFRTISDANCDDIARAAFVGLNPNLGDTSFIEALSADRFEEVELAASWFTQN